MVVYESPMFINAIPRCPTDVAQVGKQSCSRTNWNIKLRRFFDSGPRVVELCAHRNLGASHPFHSEHGCGPTSCHVCIVPNPPTECKRDRLSSALSLLSRSGNTGSVAKKRVLNNRTGAGALVTLIPSSLRGWLIRFPCLNGQSTRR